MVHIALLSVSKKTGLINLSRSLVEEFNFDLLISSGGTAQALKDAGLFVTKFDTFTRAIFLQYKTSLNRNSAAALFLILVTDHSL
ncbi:hypothetical protein [Nostoc sp. LPT]|uniref:hypothetical protein n=1 Tax=Nostoc sp. LPT TaxID=2815387 RepID=UPI001D632823|nr:hypothetical protein [Nostoc sp. LPT]MBN4000303.1 hypothetical protein [Nostoc sp. LPT]